MYFVKEGIIYLVTKPKKIVIDENMNDFYYDDSDIKRLNLSIFIFLIKIVYIFVVINFNFILFI